MGMTIDKSWYEKLKDEIAKPYIGELKNFLEKEKQGGRVVYPPEEQIFQALALTPYDQVKVVIVGQDPYHGRGQAHGLCFSVSKGVTPPPSLKNIFRELKDDVQIPEPTHGCLVSWAKQGVLLLNATLTVCAGEPRSHYGKGWELFTDAVIDCLAQRKDPIVFLLWGKSAQEKGYKLLNTHHVVLQAAHPSPYSANGFFGCRHFSKANEYLKAWGKPPIDWSL
jgi:uracil-DNA glycosylase